MPFSKRTMVDTQLTLWAATKKATESMRHSYAYLWNLPVTMFRFFTVYGPWGRPDMALFKFTRGILRGEPIAIYNHGDISRDFTCASDLVLGIRLLIDAVLARPESADAIPPWDGLSPVAQFRVVNMGRQRQGAARGFRDRDRGGLPSQGNPAWRRASDFGRCHHAGELTGYRPQTGTRDRMRHFAALYRDYYQAWSALVYRAYTQPLSRRIHAR